MKLLEPETQVRALAKTAQRLAVMSGVFLALTGVSSASVNSGGATKAMLFVKSNKPSDCLKRFDRVAIRLRDDRATNFVAVNRPRSAAPSQAYIAVLEVRGEGNALRKVVLRAQRNLDRNCETHAYLVKERILATGDPAYWKSNLASATKLIMPVVRKADLSREEFDAHWAGPHAEIAMANPVTPWRYVQNPVIEVLGESPALDGIGEQVFLDPDFDRKRAALSKDVAMRGQADALTFLDSSKLMVLSVVETRLKDK